MHTTLERLDRLVRGHRVAVVGVGNRLRGRVPTRVIDAETVPENHLGPLREASPEMVVFLDVVDHGGAPGSLCLVPAEGLAARGAATHALSLLLLTRALESEGIACWLLGFQPARMAFGEPVSPAVAAAARRVEDVLAAALTTPEAAHA
jgi:hydrogenase maturation protease